MEANSRILIFTLAKTGSTSLFFKIKNSLEEVIPIFEPKALEDISQHLNSARPILVKALMTPSSHIIDELFDAFDKRIFLVRDPRDRLVSWMLFAGFIETCWNQSEAEVLRAISMVQHKQQDPRSISLTELYHRVNGYEKGERQFGIHKKEEDFLELTQRYSGFVFHYEDLLDSRLAGLEQYLGFSLQGSASVDNVYSNVFRSGRSGDWRNWFTVEDVELLRPWMRNYMVRFGYDWEDWELAEEPCIEAAHAQGYLLKGINKRRQASGLPVI